MVGSGAITFAVWAYILAKMKPDRRDGKFYVEVNPKLLSGILGELEEQVEEAVSFLQAADSKSRSREQDGRRIVREGQFLYWVVNGAEYQKMDSHERRREYQRQKQAEYRRKKKGEGLPLAGEQSYLKAEARGDDGAMDAALESTLPVRSEDDGEGLP